MQHTHNLLCASLLPRSAEELQAQLLLCRDADMIEVRLDYLDNPDFRLLRTLVGKPCIAAVRTEEEGGFSRCTPQEIARMMNEAAGAGIDFVDIAWRYADEILPHLSGQRTAIVLSHHTSERGAAALQQTAHDMMRTEADVYKLVFAAAGPSDMATAHLLCAAFEKRRQRFVVHAMGEAGTPTRLAGAVWGNAWTYTAPATGTATAPGQIALREAIQHDIRHKRRGAKLLGLLGYPTAHSRGKILHNALLAQRFPGSPVPWLYLDVPAPDIADFRTWAPLFSGLSVTLPHKERIAAFPDDRSDDVRASGVCNTLVEHAGRWCGHNTDMTALRTLLAPHRPLLEQGVLVVGTGGTARSTIAVLQQLGVQHIDCTGRNRERGAMLAAHFGIGYTPETGKAHYGAVLQTTPVGMAPHSTEIPSAARLLQRGMLAMDVVYTPPSTPFLQLAHERGCTVISGVEMFIIQAAEQFRLFTGIAVEQDDVLRVWRELSLRKNDAPQRHGGHRE